MAPPFRNTIVVLGALDRKGPEVACICATLCRRGWTLRMPDIGVRAPGALMPAIAAAAVRGAGPTAPG